MPPTWMKAGSGKSDVMTGPLEKARFVTGAWDEKGVKESKRRSAWENMMRAFKALCVEGIGWIYVSGACCF